MFEKLRDVVKPFSAFVAQLFSWMNPHVLTIIGFLTVFLPMYFYINNKPFCGGISLLVVVFDFLDGAVARSTNRVTKFGAVFDASFDRIFDGLVIFSIIMGGYVNWYLGIVVLIGFYMVSYVRARTGEAAEQKVTLNVGIAQRGDRVLILMIASLAFFDSIQMPLVNITTNSIELAFVLLAVLTWLTVVFRLYYANKILTSLTDGKKV